MSPSSTGLRIPEIEEVPMGRITGLAFALAILAAPAAAPAQECAPTRPDRPRVEVGVGGSWFMSGGTMPYETAMVDTRVGVSVGRSWSVEGLVHFMPGTGADVNGFYRAQAVWRFGGRAFQPFLAFGGAGEFSKYSWPDYHYTDYYTGEPRVIPASRGFTLTAPFYPTAAIGFEKVVAPFLAVRAELTAAFGVNDDGIAVALLPAVSVSVPIGRYHRGGR
jgi:hypothetical protein